MNIKLNNCKTDKDYFDIISNMKLKGFTKTFMYNTTFKEISDTIKEIKDKSNKSSIIVKPRLFDRFVCCLNLKVIACHRQPKNIFLV